MSNLKSNVIEKNGKETTEVNEMHDSKKNLSEGKDLKALTLEFATEAYNYASELSDKGHKFFASELIKYSMEALYATSFTAGAFNKEQFIAHLQNGYYSCGKINEIFILIAQLGVKCANHEKLAENADIMIRMYAASIKTATKKKEATSAAV